MSQAQYGPTACSPTSCANGKCQATGECACPPWPATDRDYARLHHAPKMRKPTRRRVLDTDSATRKRYPMAAGLLDYFPDALAEVARVSHAGNEKHNPGEPMHHARGKSMDHADCIIRHLVGRGGFDGDMRESAALAWRALALLQEELELEMGLPLPRGARSA